jgi:hypothetical protein
MEYIQCKTIEKNMAKVNRCRSAEMTLPQPIIQPLSIELVRRMCGADTDSPSFRCRSSESPDETFFSFFF